MVIVALLLDVGVHAQEPAATPPPAADSKTTQPDLAHYLQTLASQRLLTIESGSVEQLRALVAEGEKSYLAGDNDAAAILLLEAVESPRFADFHGFDEYAAAEHMAGNALARLGSLQTARRYLERAIERGPSSTYYGPSVRAYSNVALELGDVQVAADWLGKHEATMTEDAKNELRYLRARARYDAG